LDDKGNIIKIISSKIHKLSGKIASDIRLGYTGGSTDMYIPNAALGTKIYAYDVNSLYPYVMKTNKYPVGSPTYFSGNILADNANAFGFFYCKIIAPEGLKHPILQTHIKTKDGIRTVAPLGTWEGMYFSEELYNARNYGYKFEVLWGYTFDSSNIFQDFVDTFYNLRKSYSKLDPMNLVAKLILNSLYGRIGMDDLFTYINIVNKKDYPKFEESIKIKESILDIIDLGENYLIQIKNPQVEMKTDLDNGFETHNVNISIAAAVTAYARIHMSHFKNNPNYNLYYTDTDSIYIDSPLTEYFISSTELGKLKLEGVYVA